jgi:hypothetical protein
MFIHGDRLFEIVDKDGGLIDIKMFFTAHAYDGSAHQALYAFDKASTKEEQDAAGKAFLTPPNKQVKAIGKDSSADVEIKKSSRAYSDLVPNERNNKEGTTEAIIRIGSKDTKAFTVRLRVKAYKDQEGMNLDIPFTGDPGRLSGSVFHGKLAFITDGQRDVAKFLVDNVYGR